MLVLVGAGIIGVITVGTTGVGTPVGIMVGMVGTTTGVGMVTLLMFMVVVTTVVGLITDLIITDILQVFTTEELHIALQEEAMQLE